MTTIQKIPTADLNQTPENWDVYRRDSADDPAFLDLVESVRANGVLEALIISQDNYVLSGHRRLCAAQVAGVEIVPAIIQPVELESMESEERAKLLIRHNKGSRRKTQEEIIRENMVSVDPGAAIRAAQARRAKHLDESKSLFPVVHARGRVARSSPLGARSEFMEAVLGIMEELERRGLLPTSVRHIHYKLLPLEVRVSTYKTGHIYGRHYKPNKKTGKVELHDSSPFLSRLLMDARSAGIVDDSWIADETRPVFLPGLHDSPADYLDDQIDSILNNYWVNPHIDQDAHLEIMVEKNTLYPLIKRRVAWPLRLPLNSGRGYSSGSQRSRINERFVASGKRHLIIIYAGDHDPDGIDMPKALAKYFKADLGTTPKIVRAAVTMGQIERLKLPPDIEAKPSSSRYKEYVRETGMTDAWEIDSMDPEHLTKELTDACKSVLDLDLFNAAMKQEKEDDVRLAQLREVVLRCIEDNAHLLDGEEAA